MIVKNLAENKSFENEDIQLVFCLPKLFYSGFIIEIAGKQVQILLVGIVVINIFGLFEKNFLWSRLMKDVYRQKYL